MEIGKKFRLDKKVTKDKLASSIGSGALDVYATPYMISLMEETCFNCVQEDLPDGQSTVGTKVDIIHISPTPIDSDVYCDCELLEIDRKRLVFNVKAYDQAGLIGEGTHERFIIDANKFMEKVNSKKI